MGSLKAFGKKYGNPPVPTSETEPPRQEAEGWDSLSASLDLQEHALKTADAVPPEALPVAQPLKSMTWIQIDKIVKESNVRLIDCLGVIYTALAHTAQTLALLVKKQTDGKIQLFLGVRDSATSIPFISKYILQKSLRGTIPGISFTDTQVSLDPESNCFIAATKGAAALNGEKDDKFIQGIERIINAAFSVPCFSALLLAEKKSREVCFQQRTALEEQFSALSKLAELTSTSSASSASSQTETDTNGDNHSTAKQNSKSENKSETKNESVANAEGESSNDGGAFILSTSISHSNNCTRTKGCSTTSGSTETSGETQTSGKNSSHATARGETRTTGTTEQVRHENKSIKNQQSELERQLKKYASASSTGLWDFSSYFIADTATTALGLASIYRGLIIGKENLAEKFDTVLWQNEQLIEAWKYLREFTHPVFSNGNETARFTSVVDSLELAICMSLPQASIPGILVKEMASLGRSITYASSPPNSYCKLGQVAHMGQLSEKDQVVLDEQLLTSHTFVTGSTGCGKSNTLYVLLQSLIERGKKVLVIEPAKGEYRKVIGKLNNVRVLGTNPNVSDMLLINPFSFPENIHVEEHIDRLIDIFNACWPMYAAMPAVLKQSISNAYISCGWDLLTSTNIYGKLFPTFSDVIVELRSYINGSEYSQDSKGDYKGALETRLQSLTNGIIGQLFSGETPLEELFEENTIIDLSRVGSLETKSLIMGMLVLKLSEYRMSEDAGMNQPLRHVTVLEEAHHLLKTTTAQSSVEGASVAGKSVEMIAAAIAEMRTYGEGFIIADQSPSLLDHAVISNTNTKIIMNLPNRLDREIACSSIGLTEAQENEVSRLHTGTAVVYQTGWEEPVMCHIHKFEPSTDDMEPPPVSEKVSTSVPSCDESLHDLLYRGFAYREHMYEAELIRIATASSMSGRNKKMFIDIVRNAGGIFIDDCAKLFVPYVGIELFTSTSTLKSLDEMNSMLKSGISKIIGRKDGRIDTFINMYVKGCSLLNESPFYETWLMRTHGVEY